MITVLRCERCDEVFMDGDTAYEIGVKRIEVQGKRVTSYETNVYACEDCVKIEDGEYQ